MAGKIFKAHELSEALKTASGGRALREIAGYGPNKALVFISHRQSDSETALGIAYALREMADVDVYLDAFNPQLSSTNSAEEVTKVIDSGLNACTHLLAVISNQTRGSWWVPYEIGIAKFRPVPRALVLLEEVKDLPEYLRSVEVLKDSLEIGAWCKDLPGRFVYKSIPSGEIPGIPRIRTSEPRYS